MSDQRTPPGYVPLTIHQLEQGKYRNDRNGGGGSAMQGHRTKRTGSSGSKRRPDNSSRNRNEGGKRRARRDG